MSSQYCQFFHLWLLPDDDLVLGVTMRAYKFIYVFRVNQVADLASCVDPVHWLAGQSVPEANASVSSSTTAAHSPMLVRRPGYSFDCCDVFAKFDLGFIIIGLAPYAQFVVIATRC